MMPPPYNDLMQIFQTPGYVTVHRELTTNLPRIIATDGRPHLSKGIRQWAGDSTGRWEGDVLVVETTNYNDKVIIQGSTAGLRVVERFTRVSADRILYQFTVDDPATWTRPWTAEVPMMKADGRLFEYACHEGNYGLVNTLRGARVADKNVKDTAASDDADVGKRSASSAAWPLQTCDSFLVAPLRFWPAARGSPTRGHRRRRRARPSSAA